MRAKAQDDEGPSNPSRRARPPAGPALVVRGAAGRAWLLGCEPRHASMGTRTHTHSCLSSVPCRWRDIDASLAWQKGVFDGLAVAYCALATVALVSGR